MGDFTGRPHSDIRESENARVAGLQKKAGEKKTKKIWLHTVKLLVFA